MRPTAPAEWRLFLALWPEAGPLAAMQAHQALWSWPFGGRPTPPEKLHMTLHFIGNVPAERVATLQQTLRVAAEPFELTLARPHVWNGGGGMAVLEPVQVPPGLLRLHAALGRALDNAGLPVEERTYRPHVTLARRARGARPPADPAPIRWQTDGRYLLVRTAAGGRYEPVQAFG